MERIPATDLLRESLGEVPAALKANPLLVAVPSMIFIVGGVLDAWFAPLFPGAPAVVGIVKGLGFGAYFRFALRAAGGVDHSGLGTSMVMMVLAFVALEYGAFGLLAPFVVWCLPLVDYAVMYNEGLEGSLGGVLDTFSRHFAVWVCTMAALIIMLVMVGFVLQLFVGLYTMHTSRENEWLGSIVGLALLGPLVHVAVLFRGRLFLALHGDPA